MSGTQRDSLADPGADADDAAARAGFDDSAARFRADHSADGEAGFSQGSGVLFEQAMAQTRMAICLVDATAPDLPIIFCNRAFVTLSGYPKDEILGRNCRFLQGPGTDAAAVARLREAILSETPIVIELVNYRKNGERFWNALHIGPIYDDAGKLRYFFGSQWDVTEVHASRTEEALAKALQEEIAHRLKNVFAVVAGFVGMAAEAEGHRDFGRALRARVQALGRAHEATMALPLTAVPVDPADLFRRLLAPYVGDGQQLTLAGGSIPLDSSTVSLIALILHELAINATKYGALSQGGSVSVSWSLEDAPDAGQSILTITWTERGGPPVTPPPPGKGTGMGILARLLDAADASLTPDWAPEGLTATLRLRLPL